jgi:heat shock protein HslJ
MMVDPDCHLARGRVVESLRAQLENRMPNPRLLIALIIASSFAIGCSDSPSLPTSPSSAGGGTQTLTADGLAGTWKLVSIQPTNQTEQATPVAASYTLTFANDRVSTRADCNTCVGGFALSGQTLTVAPRLACTVAACPTMAFANTYTTLLAGDSTVTLSGNTLVLSSARGALRFAR